jgi:hypothetical protein
MRGDCAKTVTSICARRMWLPGSMARYRAGGAEEVLDGTCSGSGGAAALPTAAADRLLKERI